MDKGKEVTVGYQYLLGMHVPLCEAPIDAVLELAFADRTFWGGRKANGRIAVQRPELFGGKAREGGVGGYIDVEDGAANQRTNDYLSARLRGLVPAFRGVAALVFRQFYIGNNPYPQPLRVKVSAVQQTFGGWLPSLAPIGETVRFDKVAVYVAIDQSLSMATGSRLATLKAALQEFVASLPDSETVAVRLQRWGGTLGSASQQIGIDASARAALSAFVDGLAANISSTAFDVALSAASDFFDAADAAIDIGDIEYVDFQAAAAGGGAEGVSEGNDPLRRVVVFITDGEPVDPPRTAQQITDAAVAILDGIERVEVIAVNIDLEDTTYSEQLDSDGAVPVVNSDNTDELAGAIYAGFYSFVDLNGVHILRDVLINPANGGEGDEALIGSSFATAAAQAFAEGMGFSFRWRDRGDVDGFRALVEKHLDAQTYFDEVTGKYEIKLIRPDYDVGELEVFGVGGIGVVEWLDPEEPDPRELPNQVTVTYTRRDTGEPGAVTVTNVAAVVASGRVINHPETYEGVTRSRLAAKLAERDLRAKSIPLVKGGFRASYIPQGLNLGSAVIVNEPKLGLSSLVVRITEIEEPDGIDNSVVVRFAQDVFAADLELDPVVEDDEVEPIDYSALPPNVTFAEELPYFELVRTFGQTDVDADLAADEGFGIWGASADQPNDLHLQGNILRKDGATWIDLGSRPLMPTWRLTSGLSAAADATTFTALVTGRETEVAVGAILQVDAEMMRVDSIAIADGVATFTVGRAVLDTVPRSHALGAYAFVWQDYAGSDLVSYTEGQTVEVRVLPQTARATASLSAVDSSLIEFASRAARPYPVGKLQVEGSYAPAGALAGEVTATWTHRDRSQQTYLSLDDHTAASIGPEDGVAYIAVMREVYLREDVFAGSGADFFGSADFFLEDVRGPESEEAISPAQSLSWDFNLDEGSPLWPADLMALELGVRTVRGSSPELENWQTPFVLVRPLLAPFNLSAENVA